MHPYYRENYGYQAADLPKAARLYPELVSLPLYPDLTDANAADVCEAVRKIFQRNVEPVLA